MKRIVENGIEAANSLTLRWAARWVARDGEADGQTVALIATVAGVLAIGIASGTLGTAWKSAMTWVSTQIGASE